MIPLIAIGLGGLVWYAQRAQGEPELDRGMSPALQREVLALSKRELTAVQLQALTEEFGRAHYHRAQELFAARLRGLSGPGDASRASVHADATIETGLAGESNPAVLRRVAAVLASMGQRDAAAHVETRAAALDAAAPPANLDELLKAASGQQNVDALNQEMAELEAELGGLDDDDDFDATEAGEEMGPEGAAVDSDSVEESIEAAMDAAERAAKPQAATNASSSGAQAPATPPSADAATEAARLDPNAEPQGAPARLSVIETEGVEIASGAPVVTARRRKGRHRGKEALEVGGQHGT